MEPRQPLSKPLAGDNVLHYSGKDRFIAARMAVCTKGILLPDLISLCIRRYGDTAQ